MKDVNTHPNPFRHWQVHFPIGIIPYARTIARFVKRLWLSTISFSAYLGVVDETLTLEIDYSSCNHVRTHYTLTVTPPMQITVSNYMLAAKNCSALLAGG
jgi:hypothetical protein